MAYNLNMGLTYPTAEDYYDVEVFNSNFSRIADLACRNRESKIIVATYKSRDPLVSYADFYCTDDNAGAIIKNAVDAAGPGGKVLLLDGTYYIKEEVFADKGVIIEGLDRSKTILQQVDADGVAPIALKLWADNIWVRNLTIRAAENQTTPAAPISVFFDNCTIENVIFDFTTTQATGAYPIYFGTGSIRACVRYCLFYRNVTPEPGDMKAENTNFAGIFIGNMAIGPQYSFENVRISLPSETSYNYSTFAGQVTDVYLGTELYRQLSGK